MSVGILLFRLAVGEVHRQPEYHVASSLLQALSVGVTEEVSSQSVFNQINLHPTHLGIQSFLSLSFRIHFR